MSQSYADAIKKAMSDQTMFLKNMQTGKDEVKVLSSGKVMKIGGMMEPSKHIGSIMEQDGRYNVYTKEKGGRFVKHGKLSVERKGVEDSFSGKMLAKYDASGTIRGHDDKTVLRGQYGSDKVKGSLQAAAGLIYLKHLEKQGHTSN